MAKRWSKKEEEFLLSNYMKLSNKELAEKFGVTVVSVKSKLRKLGLSRKQDLKGKALKVKKQQKPKAKATAKKKKVDKYLLATKLYQQAMENLHKRNYLKAIEKFQSLINNYEEFLSLADRAKMYINVCHERLNKGRMMLKNAEDYYLWGIYNSNKGNLQIALKSFQQAIKKKPKEEKILYLLASTYALIGNKSQSLKYLSEAIKLNKVNKVYARNNSDFQTLWENEEFISLTTLDEEQIKKVKV